MFSPLRLFALHDLVGELPPRQAVIGMRADGHPAVVDLGVRSSRHLQVLGPAGVGKSELLRSAVISLCLNRSPADLRCLGCDGSGRQLAVLEGLPHMQRRLAIGPAAAAELLDRVNDEAQRRTVDRQARPDWIIAIDGAVGKRGLEQTMDLIGGRGIHLLLAGGPELARADCLPIRGLATGKFTFNRGIEFQSAYLPAADLDLVVRMLRARARRSEWSDEAESGVTLAAPMPVAAVNQVGVL